MLDAHSDGAVCLDGGLPVLADPVRAVVGDPRDVLFEREAMPHLRQLYSTAWRLTRNSADAEDLVQETYLRAYRGFGGYAVGTNIRGWLLTILHRAFTDSLRKRGRSPKLVELVDEGPAAVPPNHALHGEDQRVARALERVPEVYRTAVVLRDVQDFSYEEISRTLDIPIGTVMSRIHRGRGLLRSMLSR